MLCRVAHLYAVHQTVLGLESKSYPIDTQLDPSSFDW